VIAPRAILLVVDQSPLASIREHVPGSHRDHGGDPHRAWVSRRQLVAAAVLVILVAAALVVVLRRVTDMADVVRRAREADLSWLAILLGFQMASMSAYVVLFHAVFKRTDPPLGWRDSFRVPVAGLAAGRLLPGAGAAGLVAWELHRAGLRTRTVAERMLAFFVLLDGVYLLALVVLGFGFATGVVEGPAPWGLTAVPAVVAATLLGAVLSFLLVPRRSEEETPPAPSGASAGAAAAGRPASAPTMDLPRRWIRRAGAALAAAANGVRTAADLTRHSRIALLGALAWWSFDIAALSSSFAAFGQTPPVAVVVMAFLVGQMAAALPLPGGIGGVEGGMIGAFVAFGVEGSLAVVAVLIYRAVAYWLPVAPGVVSYLQLRRRPAGHPDAAPQPVLGA